MSSSTASTRPARRRISSIPTTPSMPTTRSCEVQAAEQRGSLFKGRMDIRPRIHEVLDLAEHRVAFRSDFGLSLVYGAPVPLYVAKADRCEFRREGRAS